MQTVGSSAVNASVYYVPDVWTTIHLLSVGAAAYDKVDAAHSAEVHTSIDIARLFSKFPNRLREISLFR